MSTRALRIRDAVLTKLRAASVAGVTSERVFSDLKPALLSAMRPAIIIELGDEDAPINEFGARRRSIAVTLRILADGADPYAVIDPIRLDAHAAIMADKRMGGLCDSIEEGGSSRDRVDLDVPIGSLTTIYQAKYTTTGDLLA